MVSNRIARVKRVKLKVLEIHEQSAQGAECPEPDVVEVCLAIGPKVGSVPNGGESVDIFLGEMTYYDPKKCKNRKIDMVEAVFSADQGEEGETGVVKLNIKLTGKNEFKTPLVTTIPTDPSSVPDHCVKVSSSGEQSVMITFLEPAEGEFVAYPALYFHTTEGIIDPGISVKRGV